MNSPVVQEKRRGLLLAGRLAKTFILLLHATTKGSYFVRILAVCAALGMVLSSLFMLLEDWIELRRFDVAEFFVAAVSIVLGSIGMFLETNTLFDINNFKRSIILYAPSLERVRGRGTMYICCGTLQVLIHQSVFTSSGSFANAVGGLMIYTGYRAEKKLDVFKRVLAPDDERLLIGLFSRQDRNTDGMLDQSEFKRLVASMYLGLDDEELQAAFDTIDTNKDDKITFDEFRAWIRELAAGVTMQDESFYNVQV